MPVFLSVICITTIFAAALVYLYMDGKLKVLQQNFSTLQNNMEINAILLNKEKQQTEIENKKNQALEIKITTLEAELRHHKEKYDHLVNDTEHQLQKFENIANKVLHHQSAIMDEKQKLGIKEILDPLKEKIKTFEDKIEKTNLESVGRHESLKEQMKLLYEKSDQVSKDANNLVKALKGDYKKQGNWGELILESILDKSGLEKNREYFVQVTERNDEGKMYKPDVVIQLPDGKKLIIDSKVSLNAYEMMVNADTDDEQKIAHKAHVLAVKNHIDTLASKNYHDLYKVESPDFVLMFIPIDTALSAAIQLDAELYLYAFDKNIVMVAPSTLLATLKTVDTMWRNDKQNRFAMEIAEEAGKMYDKFVGFADDMDKLGKQLNTAQSTYHDSMKKLNSGTGNLVSRAENIKALGAKANKSLPKTSFTEES
ncbi:MAG: DNA recombination protein RmuC [Saprospiraceae bacterium]|nr:DNA recombination protein RmuC [Saprospiraceae bacterium]MBP6565628.1 DNA recombination protein RmuC [Saprospiraceae bacterium]